MVKEFSGQFENEKVLFVFKRHPIVMRKGLLIILVTILIGALVGTFMSQSAVTVGEFFSQFFIPVGIGFLVGFVALFYHWIGWYYSICIVTDERFLQLTQVGIFRKRSSNDINLNRIISVNYEIHGMLETLLGFGTIIIQTMVGDFVITKVPKPAQTQANIVSAIKESGVELSEAIQEEV
jgi:uncharacterized membrane protein YwzB